MVAAAFEELNTALSVLPLVLLPLLLFSGLFASADALPVYLSWIRYVSPTYYGYVAMALNEFSGRDLPNCDPATQNCSDTFVLESLGLNNTLPLGINLVFMLVIFVALLIGAFIVLWLKTHVRSKTKHIRFAEPDAPAAGAPIIKE